MSEQVVRYIIIGMGVVLTFVFESRFKKRGDKSLQAWFKGFGLAMLCVAIAAIIVNVFMF